MLGTETRKLLYSPIVGDFRKVFHTKGSLFFFLAFRTQQTWSMPLFKKKTKVVKSSPKKRIHKTQTDTTEEYLGSKI